jgi:hypothetical protein
MNESRNESIAQNESRRRFKMIPLIGLFLSLMGLPATAQYGDGSGSAEDPYLIFTAEQMISISQQPGDWDKHFRLTEDLDLSGMNLTDYTPIGYYTTMGDDTVETPFRGVFDGNDHTIIGFTLRRSSITALFGIVDGGAQIRNVKLIDPNVEGAYWVGALVGQLKQATVTRCTVQGGRVSGPVAIPVSIVHVGGLIGSNFAGNITDCHTTCNVPAGTNIVGGLVGENLGIIEDCFATGNVGEVKAPMDVGGLVGCNTGSIARCYATGNVFGRDYETGGLVGCNQGIITHCFSTGCVSGENGVGGLVGINRSEGERVGRIVDCYATGWVSASLYNTGGLVGANAGMISGCFSASQVSGKDWVGGLVGANDYLVMGTIINSYASGSVTGERIVGGLVGINPGTIRQCYAMGRVSGLEDVGGCIGKNQSTGTSHTMGVAIACFWNQDTSGQIFSDGGSGKSSDQMQDPKTYLDAGWDFVDELDNGSEDIWRMKTGTCAAPKLAWEPESQLLLSFNLDENPGWTIQGQWQFGQPQGLGGTEHGNPDPNAGYTGQNVYGVNLTGDYNAVQLGLFYLITNAIDCSAYRRVGLQFARWLNTDQADFIQASVEVSNDGSAWHTVWAYADTEAELMDDAWKMVCYDISSFADGHPTVYLSWSYGIVAEDAWPFSGWNIDDVSLVGLK